ncbi:hypothetical protein OBE_16838, partial [human gut metagenome]
PCKRRAATDRRIPSGGAWMDRKQIKELFDADMFVDTLETFLRKWIRNAEKELVVMEQIELGYKSV